MHVENISVQTTLLVRAHFIDEFPFVRVVWLSMTEKPELNLAIRPLDGTYMCSVVKPNGSPDVTWKTQRFEDVTGTHFGHAGPDPGRDRSCAW